MALRSVGFGNSCVCCRRNRRGQRGRWLAGPGTLGAFLDGRRKPPPSTQNTWLRTKAQLSYATAIIARAAAGGSQPPFNLDPGQLGLGGSGSQRPNINIDLSTISVVQANDKKRNDVIFKVTFVTPDLTLWVRAGVVDEVGNPLPEPRDP